MQENLDGAGESGWRRRVVGAGESGWGRRVWVGQKSLIGAGESGWGRRVWVAQESFNRAGDSGWGRGVWIIIIIEKSCQCQAGRERLTPYQSEDHRPAIPTLRMKEEENKSVGDKNGPSS